MAVGYAGSTTLSALTSPISSLHNWKGHRGSAASSEAGDFDDQRSEASYATATTATNTPRASTAGVSGLHSMEQTATQLQHNAAQEARVSGCQQALVQASPIKTTLVTRTGDPVCSCVWHCVVITTMQL